MISALLALAAATAAEPAQPAASAPPAGEKLICRKEIETGSLGRGRKICLTADEWAKVGTAARDNAQQLLDDNAGRPACNDAATC